MRTAAEGVVVKQLDAHSEIWFGLKAIQLTRLKLPEIEVAAQQASKARNIVKKAATKGARERLGRFRAICRVVGKARE